MIVTVAPGSPVPLISLSPGSTGFTTGASGAVVSLTTAVASGLVLPEPSVWFAVIVSPPVRSTVSGIVTVQLPSGFTTVVSVVPSGNSTVTVAPGSPAPLTVVSSEVTGFTTGASGAVVSLTTAVASGLVLPEPSVWFAVIVSPPVRSTVSGIVTVQLPSGFTTVVSVVPSGNSTVTVAPGSPAPLTVVSSEVIGIMTGFPRYCAVCSEAAATIPSSFGDQLVNVQPAFAAVGAFAATST